MSFYFCTKLCTKFGTKGLTCVLMDDTIKTVKDKRNLKECYKMAVIDKRYDRVIGIDLGNGLIKIRTAYRDGRPYTKTLPSIYAIYDSVGSALDERKLDIDIYKINGQEFVWGKDVISVENPIASHGHEGRYKTTPYRNMVKMILAKVYSEIGITSKESVLIVTGVPSDETKTDAENQLKMAFTNDNQVHDVKINGEQTLIKVEEEDIIVMSQPVATVIGRYLNLEGGVQDSKYENIKVAVIDVGGGTTDFDIIKELRRLSEYASIQKGFRDVYDDIRADIKKKHRTAKPTDFDLLKRIMTGRSKGVFTYRPNVREEEHDFTEALKNSIKNLSAEIQVTISTIWKNQSDIDEILLVGGSAVLFEDYVSNVMDGVEVPKNNGDSNVDGYYKFGVYQNNKMLESVI